MSFWYVLALAAVLADRSSTFFVAASAVVMAVRSSRALARTSSCARHSHSSKPLGVSRYTRCTTGRHLSYLIQLCLVNHLIVSHEADPGVDAAHEDLGDGAAALRHNHGQGIGLPLWVRPNQQLALDQPVAAVHRAQHGSLERVVLANVLDGHGAIGPGSGPNLCKERAHEGSSEAVEHNATITKHTRERGGGSRLRRAGLAVECRCQGAREAGSRARRRT